MIIWEFGRLAAGGLWKGSGFCPTDRSMFVVAGIVRRFGRPVGIENLYRDRGHARLRHVPLSVGLDDMVLVPSMCCRFPGTHCGSSCIVGTTESELTDCSNQQLLCLAAPEPIMQVISWHGRARRLSSLPSRRGPVVERNTARQTRIDPSRRNCS